MIKLTHQETELTEARFDGSRPHASSVSKGKPKPKTDSKGRDRKRTYSIGDSNGVNLLCSPLGVQQLTLLEELMEDKHLKEKLEKRRPGFLERWWLKWE